MNDIKLFKLINGQEIIGKVHAVGGNGFELKDVREIAPQQTPNGGWILTLAPYPVCLMKFDKTLYLFEHAVAAVIHTIPDELEKEYVTATSGIQLVKSI